MLEQAILDAKELKEAAIKNAQQSLIEKYSGEFEGEIERLLEQAADPAAAGVTPPVPAADTAATAGLGAIPAAAPMPGMPVTPGSAPVDPEKAKADADNKSSIFTKLDYAFKDGEMIADKAYPTGVVEIDLDSLTEFEFSKNKETPEQLALQELKELSKKSKLNEELEEEMNDDEDFDDESETFPYDDEEESDEDDFEDDDDDMDLDDDDLDDEDDMEDDEDSEDDAEELSDLNDFNDEGDEGFDDEDSDLDDEEDMDVDIEDEDFEDDEDLGDEDLYGAEDDVGFHIDYDSEEDEDYNPDADVDDKDFEDDDKEESDEDDEEEYYDDEQEDEEDEEDEEENDSEEDLEEGEKKHSDSVEEILMKIEALQNSLRNKNIKDASVEARLDAIIKSVKKLSTEEKKELKEAIKLDWKRSGQRSPFTGMFKEEAEHDYMLEELQAQISELEQEVDSLKESNKRLKSGLKDSVKLNESLVNKIKNYEQKLHESRILNYKLLYTNKALSDSSLNGQQKNKIAESIDGAKTAEEVKLLYETLKSTMRDGTSRSTPKSLSEAVERRSSSLLLRGTRVEPKKQDDIAERMKRLAGL
jgi:hypothetical protein